MGNFLSKNILLVIGTALLLFVLIAFIAPIAAHFGWDWLANPIYFVYKFLCHQRPWRSIHLWDHQVAFCTRDTFIYSAMGISAFIVHYFKLQPVKWYIAGLLILPIALDGGIQTIAEVVSYRSENPVFFYASTNFMRAVTGSLFGLSMGFLILGMLYETMVTESGMKLPNQKWYKPVLAMSYVFIFLMIFYILSLQVWNFTSEKYKPSLPLDHVRLFPGVNYEEVGRAGHGCPHPKCKLDFELKQN